jgi:hypothetical protein
MSPDPNVPGSGLSSGSVRNERGGVPRFDFSLYCVACAFDVAKLTCRNRLRERGGG